MGRPFFWQILEVLGWCFAWWAAVAITVLTFSALIGCASADIHIPKDENLSPMDGNYHVYLVRSSQYPQWNLGQTGVSVPYNADLREHWIEVWQALEGPLHLRSSACGVDRYVYMEQGERRRFRLDELVPPGQGWCPVTLTSGWNKPEGVKTELPLRGERGKAYIRVRPEGRLPGKMYFTPHQGGIREFEGVAFAQWRGRVSPNEAVNLAEMDPEDLMEPIMLRVRLIEPAPAGSVWQLFSPNGIGLKDQSFEGLEIQVARKEMIGPGKVQSYPLAGFAWEPDQGNVHDFWVGVDVFHPEINKLAGKLTLTQSEVCYKTPAEVALAVMSGVEQAKNAAEECFPRPESGGEVMLAFLTQAGRKAVAVVNLDTEEVQWMQ